MTPSFVIIIVILCSDTYISFRTNKHIFDVPGMRYMCWSWIRVSTSKDTAIATVPGFNFMNSNPVSRLHLGAPTSRDRFYLLMIRKELMETMAKRDMQAFATNLLEQMQHQSEWDWKLDPNKKIVYNQPFDTPLSVLDGPNLSQDWSSTAKGPLDSIEGNRAETECSKGEETISEKEVSCLYLLQ